MLRLGFVGFFGALLGFWVCEGKVLLGLLGFRLVGVWGCLGS